MVTTFNRTDLVSFGNSLLEAVDNGLKNPLPDGRLCVTHADVENWIAKKDAVKIISRIHAMCEESLSPEQFNHWEHVRKSLFETRSDLVPRYTVEIKKSF